MRIGYELGIPMIGPALYQQLYLPTNPTLNRAKLAAARAQAAE
jgi:hypothetical protein